MVFCEYNYCIYNKNGECQLEHINISPLGVCEDCIIPNIDKETLEKYKKETISRLEPKMINNNTKKMK